MEQAINEALTLLSKMIQHVKAADWTDEEILQGLGQIIDKLSECSMGNMR